MWTATYMRIQPPAQLVARKNRHPRPKAKFSLVEIRSAFFSRFFIYDRTDFSSETVKKGTVSVRNCSGAAPIAPCSDDQHMQLWARARRELTWLRHGPANCGQICGQVPMRALPANRTIACMHHTSLSMLRTVRARPPARLPACPPARRQPAADLQRASAAAAARQRAPKQPPKTSRLGCRAHSCGSCGPAPGLQVGCGGCPGPLRTLGPTPSHRCAPESLREVCVTND